DRRTAPHLRPLPSADRILRDAPLAADGVGRRRGLGRGPRQGQGGQKAMTFTVVGRCPRTKMLGVAMATHAPAVGNRCPVVIPRMAAASVQSIPDPRLTLLCTKV